MVDIVRINTIEESRVSAVGVPKVIDNAINGERQLFNLIFFISSQRVFRHRKIEGVDHPSASRGFPVPSWRIKADPIADASFDY